MPKKSARKGARKLTSRSGTRQEAETTAVGVDCTVTYGLFSTERAIMVKTLEGVVYAFVDATNVSVSESLKQGKEVQGKVRAFLVEETDDSLLVDLPTPTLSGGPRVAISKSTVSW